MELKEGTIVRAGAGGALLRAWERGLTLAAAVRCLGGGPAWTAAQADVLSGFRAVARTGRSPLADRAGTIANLQSLAAAWEEQQRTLQALQDRLRGALTTGAAAALGFEQVTGGTQRLVPIPRSLWEDGSAIDWERSRLNSRRGLFLEVRVLVRFSAGPGRISGSA